MVDEQSARQWLKNTENETNFEKNVFSFLLKFNTFEYKVVFLISFGSVQARNQLKNNSVLKFFKHKILWTYFF